MHKRPLVLGIVLLAGCGSAPEPAIEVQTESLLRKGADYAWQHPAVADLKAGGYSFVARYLSTDPSKNLSTGEAHALISAGIDIVLVWEVGARDMLQGWARGVADAKAAEQQAAAVGMPATRPIYFAGDSDFGPGDDAALHAYLDGAASVIGRARVGMYAGIGPIGRAFNAGKITFGWQTYAWSNGQWDPRAQLRQTLNGISVGGSSGCCDRDWSTAGDFGQWGANAPPPPPPNGECHSATLDRVVAAGTCVQSAADAFWYKCEAGVWVAGNAGCAASFPFCSSATLGKQVPARTCVQSRADSAWYQCGEGGRWDQPVENGAGPVGVCSTMYNL